MEIIYLPKILITRIIMNIFEAIETIDEQVKNFKSQEIETALLLSENDLSVFGKSFGGQSYQPWDSKGPFAKQRDSDNDGIVDAMDFFWGPGVFSFMDGFSPKG